MTMTDRLRIMDEIREKNDKTLATYARTIRLSQYRRDAGMTQAQLADASSVNLRTLQALESGKRAIGRAQLDIVLALSRALGVTVEDLAGH